MKSKLFQSTFPPLPLACFLVKSVSHWWKIADCLQPLYLLNQNYLRPFSIHELNDGNWPFRHYRTSLLARGWGGGQDDGREGERGAAAARGVYLSPWRGTATRRFWENMQRLRCFLLAASPASSLPFQMRLLFSSSPHGPSGWQSILFFGWLAVIASDLVSS